MLTSKYIYTIIFSVCGSYSLSLLVLISDPIFIEAGMQVVQVTWNHTGSILAMAGSQHALDQDKNVNVVQFYSPQGEVFMHTFFIVTHIYIYSIL